MSNTRSLVNVGFRTSGCVCSRLTALIHRAFLRDVPGPPHSIVCSSAESQSTTQLPLIHELLSPFRYFLKFIE